MLVPPLEVALATAVPEVPAARPGLAFEPKTDGWRALVFAGLGAVQSRSGRIVTHRFPEIAAAAAPLGEVVLDGELVALRAARLDFPALAAPPARRAAAGVVVYLVVFDVLAVDGDDVRAVRLVERRARLRELLDGVGPPLQLCPQTTDRAAALRWMEPAQALVGIEGVMTKDTGTRYRAGRVGDWLKTRATVRLDLLVVGVTGHPDRPEALVLALPESSAPDRRPRAVGLSLPLAPRLRREIGAGVTPVGQPRSLPGIVGGLPGHQGTRYQPVRPVRVVEVEADPQIELGRLRHRPRVRRLRA